MDTSEFEPSDTRPTLRPEASRDERFAQALRANHPEATALRYRLLNRDVTLAEVRAWVERELAGKNEES